MPDSSENPNKFGGRDGWGGAYWSSHNKLLAVHKDIIKDIILREKGYGVSFPLGTRPIERYMSGFEFRYIPKSELIAAGYPQSKLLSSEGSFHRDKKDGGLVYIVFDDSFPESRQNFTKVHELFHFMQGIETGVLNELDRLVYESKIPEDVIVKLLERATNKAAAMYLMPHDYFYEKLVTIRKESGEFEEAQLRQLARFFGVSTESANYRIRELNINPQLL